MQTLYKGTDRRQLKRCPGSRGACYGLVAVVSLFWTGLFWTGVTANAQAQRFDFEHGHWAGKAEDGSVGVAEACVLSLHNSKDQMIIFRLERSGRLSLGLFGHGWAVRSARLARLLILVDHTIIHFGLAIRAPNSTLFAVFSNPELALSAVSSGAKINISWGERNAVFMLHGSRTAIRFLRQCLRIRNADNHSGSLYKVRLDGLTER